MLRLLLRPQYRLSMCSAVRDIKQKFVRVIQFLEGLFRSTWLIRMMQKRQSSKVLFDIIFTAVER
jgi:hypothetical protein